MTNDLKFSGVSPVVITYNGSPDDIYAPVRTSSCDINIVSTGILDDLYTAKKDDICVRIKRGNTTIWEGYKMPNTYSQGVSLNLDSITMTCIDPVSILKFVTVDKILEKPNIVTYKNIIGKALAYVMLDANTLWVERTVSYDGTYSGSNGLLDLSIQVANFWDEAEKPSTVYEMIEEMLRPFCLTLVYYDNSYQIYNPNKTTGTRHFDKYSISSNGTLTRTSTDSTEIKATGLYNFANDDWKSNNTQTPSIEINSTYEKVTGVASTSVPEYSDMVFDHINYTQRDKYDYGDLNVQRNKTKGYTKRNGSVVSDTADYWFYIWNGVYTDANYDLVDAGLYADWYNTCNKAYYYLTGNTGRPNNWGSALTFYGGIQNPSATSKSQAVEKSVKVSKKITAYAEDNGVPPEFLEVTDLDWSGHVSQGELSLTKQNTSNTKFGTGIPMRDSDRLVYRQDYEHIYLNSTNNPTLNFDISRSFSRTGIDLNFDALNFNTATNVTYTLGGNLSSCDTNYCPQPWNSSEVVVNSIYFRRYSSGSTIRVTQVWDKRRIDMYVVKSDNSILQFNGKEWVSVQSPSSSNCFYLLKLMNNEHLFLTEHRYDVIETSDGERFSLNDEPFSFYTDNNGGVYPDGTQGTEHTYQPYRLGNKYWQENVYSSSSGQMSIMLPLIDDSNVSVFVDVYNSTMLGMTGCDDIGGSFTYNPFYYGLGGGEFTGSVYVNFLPKNLSHVKAEHLNLDINISVPESNLGQMFQESDIKYELDSDNDYIEEFEGPSFLVNSYNPLVASSFSYLIYNNSVADPNLFIVASRSGRPESYTVQAYFNWLSKIRKIYTKTLIPETGRTRPFANVRCYITSPEVGSNELLVVKDTWDVKTNRHTVTAVEDQNLEVGVVSTVDVFEIPRRARADRYNLPTATKKN